MVTESQLNQLRKEYKKKGNMTLSAMKAGMDRKTARKYLGQPANSPSRSLYSMDSPKLLAFEAAVEFFLQSRVLQPD
jgi:hypothetical protein